MTQAALSLQEKQSTSIGVRSGVETSAKTASVGVVIVSCSRKIAEGTAELVRHLVGNDVAIAYAGGKANGDFGIEVGAVFTAIESVWSDEGVVVLLDFGSTELESERAILGLPSSRQKRTVLCNAPLVEGAFMAALEAARGGDLQAARRAAEGS